MDSIDFKAVRDEIPVKTDELVKLPDHIFIHMMREKLYEELREYNSSHEVEELVDIVEVCYRIAELQGVHSNLFDSMRSDKAAQKGKFAFNNVWCYKKNNILGYKK